MKKISTISVFVSTVALAGICGCASNSSNSGNSSQSSQPAQTTSSTTTTQSTQNTQNPPPKPKDKRPIEERLVVGMSMDDVRQACGNPKDESSNSDGSATWVFRSGSPTYNPIFGWGAHFHIVTVVFGTNGKVQSWSTSSSTTGNSPF
jgi:hypothetical protein